MSWRARMTPIIARVIREVGTEDMAKLRAELRAAFPFSSRKNHPYKIWLDEIRYQLGQKPKVAKAKSETPGQSKLF